MGNDTDESMKKPRTLLRKDALKPVHKREKILVYVCCTACGLIVESLDGETCGYCNAYPPNRKRKAYPDDS